MRVRDGQISFEAVVERIAPEVPRFVVYPGKAWDETGTFIVDVSLNGVSIGLRNLIPWKERGWHFGLSEPICRKVQVDTGDRVHVEMRRLGDARPDELEELLKANPKAQKVWNGLPPPERRILCCSLPVRRKLRPARARRDGFSAVDPAAVTHSSCR